MISLSAHLAEVVAKASRDELPELIGQIEADLSRLETLKSEAKQRLINSSKEEPVDPVDRLLTIPEVAQVLGVSKSYVYGLVRQRKFPAVRLPGLEKAGRDREGKNVRVRLGVLQDWLESHEDRGLRG